MDNPIVIFVVMVLFMVLGALALNWDIRRQARKDQSPVPAQAASGAIAVPTIEKAA